VWFPPTIWAAGRVRVGANMELTEAGATWWVRLHLAQEPGLSGTRSRVAT
jgi:hypothetical protein